MRDNQQRRTLVTKSSSHLEDFIRKMKWKHYYPLRTSEIKKECANTQREPIFSSLSLCNKFDKQFGGAKWDEQEIKEPYVDFSSSFKSVKRPVWLVVYRFRKFI